MLVIAQPKKFHAQQINLPENFRDKYIIDACRDNNGFIWFVTNDGLHRFDGTGILTFDLTSKPALPEIVISKILADHKNNLWILSKKYIIRFNLTTWRVTVLNDAEEPASYKASSFLKTITEGIDGSIYAGTVDGTIYKAENNVLTLVASLKVDENTPANSYNIITLNEPVPGELWVTNNNSQIIKFVADKSKFRVANIYGPKDLRQYGIHKIYYHDSGVCVYQYMDTMYILNMKSGIIAPFNPINNSSFNKVYKGDFFAYDDDYLGLVPDNFSSVNTGKPVYVYDFKHRALVDFSTIYPERLQSAKIWRIHPAGKETLIISNHGIMEIREAKSPFTTYLSNEEGSSIRSIYKHTDNRLYINAYGTDFTRLDESTGKYARLADSLVYCMLPWKHDTLLCGNETDGLFWYDMKKGKFSAIVFSSNGEGSPGVPYYGVDFFSRENDSLVWVGTYEGVYLVNPITKSRKDIFGGRLKSLLQQSRVYGILALASKKYFATSAGIFVYDITTSSLSRLFENTKYAGTAYSSLQWIDQKIWAGSYGNGLLIFDTSGYIHKNLTTNEGLAGNVVYSIRQLKDYVIAGTGDGLNSIHLTDSSITSYSTLDLLPSDEFNHSASFIKNDTAYFGTINGLVSFTIASLQQYGSDPNAVKLHITDIATGKDNQILHNYALAYIAHPALIIQPHTDYFSIHFGGTEDALANMSFLYRLTSADEWIDIGHQKEITFVGLAPGIYSLELKGRFLDGRTFEKLLAIRLTIKPAFYQTILFKALLIACSIALIILIFKQREKRLIKEQQLRTKIAGDLHDEVGSSLTRIHYQADLLSVQTQMADNNAANAESLFRIAESSRQALSSMNDMIWSIDSRFDTIADLVQRMQEFVNHIREDLQISCKLQMEGNYESQALSQKHRQNLFLIFKEALNNAVKYANPAGIQVMLQFNNGITLTVENAYDPNFTSALTYKGGNGLEYMRKRAGDIHGALSIEKSDGRFVLRLVI